MWLELLKKDGTSSEICCKKYRWHFLVWKNSVVCPEFESMHWMLKDIFIGAKMVNKEHFSMGVCISMIAVINKQLSSSGSVYYKKHHAKNDH
jgi:hypothetical protein